MIILNTTGDRSEVCFDPDELLILNNALNEICHGFKLKEFEKNIGTTEEIAKNMRSFFGLAIDLMDELNEEKNRE